MDHAARGAAALSNSDGLDAVSAFTKALIQHPTSPDYFIQRSTAFTRLKAPHGPRYDFSLKDAEFAVLLSQRRAKREKIQAGQQRRVVALFGLGRYGDANFVLGTMQKWRTSEKKDKMEGDIWKAKIEQKMKGLPDHDEKKHVTAKEYPGVELPSEKELKAMLQHQLKADGTFRFNGEQDEEQISGSTGIQRENLPKLNPAEGKTEIQSNGAYIATAEMPVSGTNDDIAPPKSTTTASALVPAPATLSKIRHEWYQNAQTVTVTIYAKGVKKDKAEIDIQEDSVSIAFPHPSDSSSTFEFTLDPLFAFVDPSSSTSSIMSTKVEFSLRKRDQGQKWPVLEGTEPLKAASAGPEATAIKEAIMTNLGKPPLAVSADTVPSYPTSSRTGPKNWDKLATDLTAKKKKIKSKKRKDTAGSGSEGDDDDIDSDYDTGDAVDGFFKKLYAGADPDTRRAMMKSFQESNGTALSTNWKEVGKGKVEPVKSKDDDD